MFWSTAAVTKLLTIGNNGALGCVVHWTKQCESSHLFDRESLTFCDEYGEKLIACYNFRPTLNIKT